MRIKKTTKEFIESAILVHGNKYNYSQSCYINMKTKIKIFCNKHKDFFYQRPDHHLSGHGCHFCAGVQLLSTKDFLRRAIEIQGNKYDYSLSVYKKNSEKVIIICKKHGEFRQSPNAHLMGQGCPACGVEKYSIGLRQSEKQFIFNAISVHGKKYDYSKVNYNNAKEKVIIMCKFHGEFKQTPDNHLRGRGCPHCIYKNEGLVKKLLLKYFKDWKIIPNKKIWDTYKGYTHKRYCDFWMEKEGAKVMIEYDGVQHYKPVRFNGITFKKANKLFKDTKLKDRLDSKFCKDNNILLYRIKYTVDKEKFVNNLVRKISEYEINRITE